MALLCRRKWNDWNGSKRNLGADKKAQPAQLLQLLHKLLPGGSVIKNFQNIFIGTIFASIVSVTCWHLDCRWEDDSVWEAPGNKILASHWGRGICHNVKSHPQNSSCLLIRGAPKTNIFGKVGILSQPAWPPLPEYWDSQKGKQIAFRLF